MRRPKVILQTRAQSRRSFIKHLASGFATLGGISALSPASWGNVPGANDTIRMGVVGIRGRGRGAIRIFHQMSGVKVTALCDADTEYLDRERAEFTSRGERVETYLDYRRLLESDEIDAVAIATPNHWHALMGVWACEAGKDAYIEKPISHNVWEGRQITRAAEKHNRVVQGGTQYRSDPGVIEAVRFVREGNLGRIACARGFAYFLREPIGLVSGPQVVPPTVNYELWTGPAALTPLLRKSLHKDWHFVWNTGNGELCNMGVHEMDICRWFLGENSFPKRVMSIGGRFGPADDGETPNTQVVLCDFETAPVIFEVRGLPRESGTDEMDAYEDMSIGVVIECEGGSVRWGRAGGAAYDKGGKKIRDFQGNRGRDHHRNFIDAVRSRRPGQLNCPAEVCHVSSGVCHIGNISHRIGSSVAEGEIREGLASTPRLLESFGRMTEHLSRNNISLAKKDATLGPMLEFDATKEQFVGEHASVANPMLMRQHYRRGFQFPSS